MARKPQYGLPPGAVAPQGGYPPGWGPPFATARDCPAPDWNHLCAHACAARGISCVGLSAAHLAQRRQPGESDRAWLWRVLDQHAPLRARRQAQEELAAVLHARVVVHRRKRGLRRTIQMLAREGRSSDEIAHLLHVSKVEVVQVRSHVR